MDNQQQQKDFNSIFTDSELLKIQIRESDIPGSGYGLFAKEQIKPGQYIAEYYGAIIPQSLSFSQPFLMEDKMVFLNEKYSVISRSPASRANDIIKWQPQQFMSQSYSKLRKNRQIRTIEGKTRNSKISLVGRNKAFLTATLNIHQGQQIFTDYGFQYWEFFFKEYIKNK